jgi:hypothetical protein
VTTPKLYQNIKHISSKEREKLLEIERLQAVEKYKLKNKL